MSNSCHVCHHSCSLQVIDILPPKVLRGLDLQDRGNFQSHRVWWRHYPWIHGTKEFLKDKVTSSGNKLASYVVGTHLINHHRSLSCKGLWFLVNWDCSQWTGWTTNSSSRMPYIAVQSKEKGVNLFGSLRFLHHAHRDLYVKNFKLLLYDSLHPTTNKRDHELYPQESGASSKFSGLTSQCISPAVRSSRKAHKSCHPKSRTVGNRGKPLPALLQLRNKSWFQQHTTHEAFLWSNY